MDTFLDILQMLFSWAGIIVVVLFCLVGLALSCVSISGTWLVLIAAGIAAATRGDSSFPGLVVIAVYTVLCIVVEVVEAAIGAVGVKQQGGSALGATAAVVGGLAGFVLGVAIPIPVAGPFIGMCLGSFALVYFVEFRRLQKADHAAAIAWGSVVARLLMVLLKVVVTLGMTMHLLAGMAFS